MILQVGETSLTDNTSVNEDDYVYEDDWEEEPEKKDSEEDRKGMHDELESSKNIPRVSGKPFSLLNEQAISKMEGGHISNIIPEQSLCTLLSVVLVHCCKIY
jgi:hypothetical protein